MRTASRVTPRPSTREADVGKLTKAEREALCYILANGPGTLPLTASARTPAHVARLVDAGYLETLNRLLPSTAMYEMGIIYLTPRDIRGRYLLMERIRRTLTRR